jgi:hypothetical protein
MESNKLTIEWKKETNDSKKNAYDELKKHLIEVSKNITKSRKHLYTFKDVVKFKDLLNDRGKNLVDAFVYIDKKPLRNNDYYKYLNAYKTTGVKLKEKYFRHDLTLLNELYERYKDDKVNPFNIDNYNNYVLFMSLKLHGHYQKDDDVLFNVTYKDNREYNPLSKTPSILRSCLPFEVMEFDIKRAFPTFIDIELNTNYRTDIYEKITKKQFATYLNCNNQTKVSLNEARKKLSLIYKDRTTDVLTDNRYNEKGSIFRDLTKYEKEYIEKFVDANNLKNYARLHDGIFVLKGTECNTLKIDFVEFSIKESIKPTIENDTVSFYRINDEGLIETSPSTYADFLIQEKFKRITTPDDKILLLKDSNNVIDYFNHKTNMVSFLVSESNEVNNNSLKDTIAKDNFNVLNQSYTLIPPTELIYYKDTKTSFGLPFKNGFFFIDEFTDIKDFKINHKEYTNVNGFFTPHNTQKRDFVYTDEVGDFEIFLQRISTGVKDIDLKNAEHVEIISAFYSMIGYYCHNYKSMSNAKCIILTDEGANDETRNGGRGKTLIGLGLKEVSKMLIKAGNEFNGKYIHMFAELDKSYNLYLIDDVPADFNYNDLYTVVTGCISSQKKGKPAEEIEFDDCPKFLVSSNWLIRYNEDDNSTNRRFVEYKIKPYYNAKFKVSDEFENEFFKDWDSVEWNKFYSFIFRSVNHYLKNGLICLKYDKTDDNFKASFNSDVKLSEMERIMNELLYINSESFSVRGFLNIYRRPDNVFSKDNFFHQNNTKNLINLYLTYKEIKNFVYKERLKCWVKV